MGIKVAKERAICREHHFRLERGNLLSKAAHFQLHQLPRAVTQAVPVYEESVAFFPQLVADGSELWLRELPVVFAVLGVINGIIVFPYSFVPESHIAIDCALCAGAFFPRGGRIAFFFPTHFPGR